MILFLNESIARRRFKDLLGQANHLLITILVGLQAVERGLIKECPKELHAAWNPKDFAASAGRSRIMVLEMTLVRATDALDTYITWARREPRIIQDISIRNKIDGWGQKILKKFETIRDSCPDIDEKICALIEVMIVWRNKSVHSLAENTVSENSWKILDNNKSWLKDTFRGMEFERLLIDFNSGGPPTFKETASFIRATHMFVEYIDGYYLKKMDPEVFLKSFIWHSLDQNQSSEKFRKKVAQSIWGRDKSEKLEKVVSFLKNNGLSDKRSGHEFTEFGSDLIIKISALLPTEVIEYCNPNE